MYEFEQWRAKVVHSEVDWKKLCIEMIFFLFGSSLFFFNMHACSMIKTTIWMQVELGTVTPNVNIEKNNNLTRRCIVSVQSKVFFFWDTLYIHRNLLWPPRYENHYRAFEDTQSYVYFFLERCLCEIGGPDKYSDRGWSKCDGGWIPAPWIYFPSIFTPGSGLTLHSW